MNDALQYAILEQLERIADAIESRNVEAEQELECLKLPPEAPPPDEEAYLSKYLERIPTFVYNSLRQKLLPASLAARIIGIPPAQLSRLAELKVIASSRGRFDVMSLLMMVDERFCSNSEAQDEKRIVFKQ